MGYHTWFDGEFKVVNGPLKDEHRAYLVAFNETRRMARDAGIAATLPDPVRDATDLHIGSPDAAYFVGGKGSYGHDRDPSILDYNEPPGASLSDWVIPTVDEEGFVTVRMYPWDQGKAERFDPNTQGYAQAISGLGHPIGKRCDLEGPHAPKERAHWMPEDAEISTHPCVLGEWRPPIDSRGRQPGLWCQWRPNDDGTAIVWDEGEKFYSYIEWLAYIMDHFLRPWGYELEGSVYWDGEESDDFGVLEIKDNKVLVSFGKQEYTEAQIVG